MLSKNILNGIINTGRDMDELNEKIFVIDTADDLMIVKTDKLTHLSSTDPLPKLTLDFLTDLR